MAALPSRKQKLIGSAPVRQMNPRSERGLSIFAEWTHRLPKLAQCPETPAFLAIDCADRRQLAKAVRQAESDAAEFISASGERNSISVPGRARKPRRRPRAAAPENAAPRPARSRRSPKKAIRKSTRSSAGSRPGDLRQVEDRRRHRDAEQHRHLLQHARTASPPSCAARASMSAKASVLSAVNCIERDRPAISISATTSAYGVCGEIAAQAMIDGRGDDAVDHHHRCESRNAAASASSPSSCRDCRGNRPGPSGRHRRARGRSRPGTAAAAGTAWR